MQVALRAIAVLTFVVSMLPGPIGARPDEEIRPDAALLQYPDVGRDKIVFLFANDLWLVDRKGGQAAPLASPPGLERFPKFSPDGKAIAFSGNYDGNPDLYTIPVTGGVPVRVTHHPSRETLCGWMPCGRLLYYTSGQSGFEQMPKLYQVDSTGGMPEDLPVPYGAAGAISPDGKWLAYTPHTRDSRTWKRYRGGMATDIWLFNLETKESKKITDWEGTDTLPMWNGNDRLFYMSDRGEAHKLNIWFYDLSSGTHHQSTFFKVYDVKWPSICPDSEGSGAIVLQNGSALYLMDLSSFALSEVKVTIPGARPTVKPKSVDAAKLIQDWNISSTGKRALVQARGDIWTLPAEHGSPRNLTRTSGTAERSPSWSPDGRWIAYFSDATGEYELYITQSDGKGETRMLTADSKTFYTNPVWSPDSKKIAFSDKAARIHLLFIDSGERRIIDKDPWGYWWRVLSWSHDSRWLAFIRTGEENQTSSVILYDVEKGESHQVTGGMFSDRSPVFDRKGDYLYFVSSRSFTPTSSDIDDAFIYEKSQILLAVPLLEEIDSTWLAESDEETWKEDEKKEEETEEETEEESEEKGGEDAAKAPAPADDISGTWEGVAQTPEGDLPFTMNLQMKSDKSVSGSFQSLLYSGDIIGSYDEASKTLSITLTLDQGPVVIIEMKVSDSTMSGVGTADGDTVPVTASRISDSSDEAAEEGKKKDKKEKAREKVEIDIDGFEQRAILLPVTKGSFGSLAVNDKNQLIYARRGDGGGIKLFDMKDKKKQEKSVSSSGGSFAISADGKKLLVISGSSASIQKAAPGGTAKRVPSSGMTAVIEPLEEWRQIFVEVWRLQRDYFYLENLHNVDWDAIRLRYGKMLDACTTRSDVSYVIREMISELNVGHAYYYGGDVEEQPRVNVGLLGVDWELLSGAYRFAAIFEGAAWDVDARAPLSESGLDVKVGDYLLAVNGIPVDTAKDPWAAFIGLSGKTITLTVSEKPVLDDAARTVVVKPIGSEGNLRYRAWIERNRAYVEKKTDGQVGYIYVPDTGWSGRNDFFRQYYGQTHKKALIIDERWNKGGYDPAIFIQKMNRPITNFWARRDGKDMSSAEGWHQGPKCMLINGLAGSGGDNFPWLFRKAKLGKLIGMRTWGGLVGLSGNPGLIDGGYVSVPTFGFYETDGTWGVEGHGVDPDIEVIDDPALMVDGGDPQLDAAIALMLEEIKTFPYITPKRPPSPDRRGMGLPENDW